MCHKSENAPVCDDSEMHSTGVTGLHSRLRHSCNPVTQSRAIHCHFAHTREFPKSRVYTRCVRIRPHTCTYADCRRSFLYTCRRLRPAHTRGHADCRRQSSNMLNFQGQRRPAQASQSRKRSKVTARTDMHVVLHRDVCGRMPTHTFACLYFYPRRNLRYAEATHRQTQAWTFAPAADAWRINPALYWHIPVDSIVYL